MRGRVLWLLEAIAIVIAIAVITVLIQHSFGHFWRAWSLGDSTIDAELPTWPSKLAVPAALTLLWLRLLLQLVGYARLVRRPAATPVAVPVILAVEEVAKHEIEEALGHDAREEP